MNHEHMNVKNVKNEVEPTGPKKPWVTPRLDYLDRECTDNGAGAFSDFEGSTYTPLDS